MHPILQNRYVRFAGIGLVGLVFIFIFASVILASLNSSRSLGLGGDTSMIAPAMDIDYAPGVGGATAEEFSATERSVSNSALYYEPTPNGYTAGLEDYETASYNVAAKTKQFDDFCASLTQLKANPNIDFKSMYGTTNQCRATFYTNKIDAPSVVASLQQFSGVEVTHSVVSVARHRQQIQSRSDIIRQQLNSVNRSLAIAETEFDQIAAFARTQNDAKTLSEAIREKLSLIDTLTQRKISLTSQLDNIAQQAADLEERIDVVEFSVFANRLNPIIVGESERKWTRAWEELSDTFTDTLIGLTAFFGIFLLWVVRLTVYLLVLLLVLRGLWKFVQFVWQRW